MVLIFTKRRIMNDGCFESTSVKIELKDKMSQTHRCRADKLVIKSY